MKNENSYNENKHEAPDSTASYRTYADIRRSASSRNDENSDRNRDDSYARGSQTDDRNRDYSYTRDSQYADQDRPSSYARSGQRGRNKSRTVHSDQAVREHIYNYLHDVLLKWHLILLAMVAVAVIADSVITFFYEPTYTTQASVIVKQDVYEEEGESLDDVASALGYVISSDVFLEQIKEDLGVKTIHGTYSVSDMEGTNILKIKAQANSPETSYHMMYYMMKRYKDVMHYVVGDTTMRVIEEIQVPTEADNSVNHQRNLLFFGLIGAAAMIGLLALQSAMRDTIKCQEDVHDKLQVRMLADIATESKWYMKGIRPARKRGLLMTQLSTSFTFVETFKRLGTRFETEAREHDWKVVLVNSTWEDEGKTSVIANLAIQLAQMNRRVLLVDTDFGKPALEKILHVEPEHGLEEALRGEMTFADIIYHDKMRKMDCVFVKKVISDATALLESDAFTECLNTVRDDYDYILLDTPPTSYLGMSMIVAQHADAVLLVTRQNFAPTVLVNRTIERYLRQETPVMGVVLNRSMPRIGLSGRSYR